MNRDKNLPKSSNSGFSVPEGYFNKAAGKSRLLVKMRQSLDEIPLHTPENNFQTPEGYFEESKYHILAKVHRQTRKVIVMRREFLRMAAVFTALLALSYFISLNFQKTPSPQIVQNHNTPVLLDAEYYLENEKDLSDFDWSQLLSDAFLSGELVTEPLSNNEMEDYLAENLNIYDLDEQQP